MAGKQRSVVLGSAVACCLFAVMGLCVDGNGRVFGFSRAASTILAATTFAAGFGLALWQLTVCTKWRWLAVMELMIYVALAAPIILL